MSTLASSEVTLNAAWNDPSTLRHPLWSLIGAIIGAASTIGAVASISSVSAAFSFGPALLILFSVLVGAGLFRKGVLLTSAWLQLVAFPLVVSSGLFLGGLFIVSAAGSTASNSNGTQLLVIVLVVGSVALSLHSRRMPPRSELVRQMNLLRYVFLAVVFVSIVVLVCAAYLVPVPRLRDIMPYPLGAAFVGWLSMTLLSLAWVASIRLFPKTPPPRLLA